MEVVHSSRFNLAMSSPSVSRGSETHIVLLLLRRKRQGLIILLGFILSTLCHHTSCITLFVMNLICREASIEALSKWSNSSKMQMDVGLLVTGTTPMY